MKSNSSENDLTLSDVVVTMDIVDTLRHDKRMQEYALSEGDRRQAAIEQIKKAYSSQGVEVSDETISMALEKKREDELAHNPKVSGFIYLLAKLYVFRNRIFKYTASLILVVMFASAGYQYTGYLSDKRFAQYQTYISETLFEQLSLTIDQAEKLQLELGEDISLKILAANSEFERAKRLNDVSFAEAAIADVVSAISALERKKLAQVLAEDVDGFQETMFEYVTDEVAREILQDKLRVLRQVAATGIERDYSKAKLEISDAYNYIMLPFEFRIVNRNGVRSGVERTHDQTGAKSWYIIVEAVSPSGEVYPLKIRDRLLGKTKTMKAWGIKVTEEQYLAVGADKKDNGVIDDEIAGSKAAREYDITWTLDAYTGETINSW